MKAPSSAVKPVILPGPEAASDLELVRKGDPDCVLIQGDNLASLRGLSDQGIRFALAYLDPPFLTGREHALVERKRGKQGEIVRTLKPAFDDRWDSLDDYLAAIKPRIAAARDLLMQDGSLILHVDPKTSHYLKVACDQIFGRERGAGLQALGARIVEPALTALADQEYPAVG